MSILSTIPLTSVSETWKDYIPLMDQFEDDDEGFRRLFHNVMKECYITRSTDSLTKDEFVEFITDRVNWALNFNVIFRQLGMDIQSFHLEYVFPLLFNYFSTEEVRFIFRSGVDPEHLKKIMYLVIQNHNFSFKEG